MPTEISTLSQLDDIRNNLAGDYVLVNDIDASPTETWNDGDGFLPIGSESAPFTGTLDGAGHAITGLFMDRGNRSTGLFGVAQGATIKGVRLIDADIAGEPSNTDHGVGALCGWLRSGTVLECFSSGDVRNNGARQTGGLIGRGGATASNQFTITRCASTASVFGSGQRAGGIIGMCRGGKIFDSWAGGYVTSDNTNRGGLVGVLWQSGDEVVRSFAFAEVAGTSAADGGLVGNLNGGSVSASFWDTEASGQASSGGGTGLTTAQAKTLSTYSNAGWDIVAGVDDTRVWGIDPGINDGYPFLQVFQDASPPATSSLLLRRRMMARRNR